MIRVLNFVRGNDEGHDLDRVIDLKKSAGGCDSDQGGIGDRKPIGTAANGGESDRPHAVFDGNTEGVAIAIRKRFRFAAIST